VLWLLACGDPTTTPKDAPETSPEDSATIVDTQTTPRDSASTPTGDTSTTTTPIGPLTVQGVELYCDEYSDVGGEALTAEAPQPGGIRVHHEAFLYDCFERVLLRVDAASVGQEVAVTYEIGHSTADCTNCSIDLDYTLGGVAPGTWTVTAQGQAVEVDVP
jgi:hypothetical protein